MTHPFNIALLLKVCGRAIHTFIVCLPSLGAAELQYRNLCIVWPCIEGLDYCCTNFLRGFPALVSNAAASIQKEDNIKHRFAFQNSIFCFRLARERIAILSF